jgi:polysaccharide pyruvyl transferase WcaK-like protein
MKISITEGASTTNIGSAALIENAIKIVRQIHPNSKITVHCQQPSLVKELVANDILVVQDLFIVPSVNKKNTLLWLIDFLLWIIYYKTIRLFTKKPARYMFSGKKQTLQIIQEADYIYCIGAERINDIYFKTAYISLLALSIFQGLDKRLIHLSLTIGPIFYKTTIYKAKKVLNNSYAIYVRDNKSYELLKELKIEKPIICNSHDIAILQQLEESNGVREMLIKKGINMDKPIIGVSVIYWKHHNVKSSVSQFEYNNAIAEVLDFMIFNFNYQVLFTPTVINGRDNDDVHISHKIYDLMKAKKNTYFIENLLTPKQLSSVFSMTRFSIVTRMHAAILCSCAGAKPIIAINYLYKLREYMKSIEFEDYSIDIANTNSKDLISLVVKMEQNYISNKEKLNNRISEMQSKLQSDLKKISKQI